MIFGKFASASKRIKAENQAKNALEIGKIEPISKEERLQLFEIENDREALRGKTISEKVNKKKLYLIPKYWDIAQQYIDGKCTEYSTIPTTLMIWCLDAGEFEKAFNLIRIIMKLDLPSPKYINRTPETFFFDFMIDYSLGKLNSNQSPSPYFDELYAIFQGHPFSDERTIKLEVGNCKLLDLQEKYEEALEAYKTIFDLYQERAKVKTRLNELEKIVKKIKMEKQTRPPGSHAVCDSDSGDTDLQDCIESHPISKVGDVN